MAPRRNRRIAPIPASLLALTGALLASQNAAAEPILDQSSDFESGFSQFDLTPRAQLFTVGVDGALEAVELFAAQLNPNGNLVVSIFETVNGEPPMPGTALPLTTGTIPLSAMPSSAAGGTGPAFVRVELVDPIAVLAGEPLALFVQADAGGGAAGRLVWFGNFGRYAGGEAWRFDPGGFSICATGPPCVPGIVPPSWKLQGAVDPFDFAFRTYVPEPSLGLMLAVGVAAIAGPGRRGALRQRR